MQAVARYASQDVAISATAIASRERMKAMIAKLRQNPKPKTTPIVKRRVIIVSTKLYDAVTPRTLRHISQLLNSQSRPTPPAFSVAVCVHAGERSTASSPLPTSAATIDSAPPTSAKWCLVSCRRPSFFEAAAAATGSGSLDTIWASNSLSLSGAAAARRRSAGASGIDDGARFRVAIYVPAKVGGARAGSSDPV
jgi:hypothetical protein